MEEPYGCQCFLSVSATGREAGPRNAGRPRYLAVTYGDGMPLPGAGGGGGAIATTVLGELIRAPGLYVVDGAALPSLPASHPTLTIMANADRIGRALARRLLSGERPR